MLKSTVDPLSKEQFVKLREARQLIAEQFGVEFSLQSEAVVTDVYDFALQSESNELFRLFCELNAISDQVIARPLNEEQLVLLREAKKLIAQESGAEFRLIEPNVMDLLYGYALASQSEDLLDIFLYLCSRPDCPPLELSVPSSPYLRSLRAGACLVQDEFKEAVPLESAESVSVLGEYAERSANATLKALVTDLVQPEPAVNLAFLFKELSAANFERLRQAKLDVGTEFGAELSLLSSTGLDDLYDFGVRSTEPALFDLFHDLLISQSLKREAHMGAQGWLSKEQFVLLSEARERVKQEFGGELDLRSATLLEDVYQYALKAQDEELFGLCWEFQQSCLPGGAPQLPSKDEFRMLRKARSLIAEEFSEELQLESDVLEYDLYRFAVRSETDDLFELHSTLVALPERITAISQVEDREQLSHEEFVILRSARRLVQEEFDEYLTLEVVGVLDRLYGFALASKDETLFDLHAQLNVGAVVGQAAVPPDAESMADLPQVTSEADVEAIRKPQKKTNVLQRIFGTRFQPESSRIDESDEDRGKDGSAESAERVVEETAKAADTAKADEEPQTNAEPQTSAESQTRAESRTSEDLVAHVQNETEHKSAPRKDFGDLLVKAMGKEQAKSPISGVKKPVASGMTSGTRTPKKPDSPKVREVDIEATVLADSPKPRSKPRSGQQARSESNTRGRSQITWFVSSGQDGMRLRLVGPLHVGVNGDLLLTTPGTIGATFDLIDEQPIIAAESVEVFVNDELVDKIQELASGDKIVIADETLIVDSISESSQGVG